MNKKHLPKQKKISKTYTNANKQEGKAQNQVKYSSRKKTHTCYLKILSWKEAIMEFEKLVHEVFGKEKFEKEDEQSQKFEGKLKKI